MSRKPEHPVVIDGPVGPLQAVVHQVEHPAGVAVVCHPHPLHQGTMDNKVVHTVSRAFAKAGIEAVRFNFRGVGDSAGEYDDGRGEIDDAMAVADWAVAQHPGVPVWLAGFSFGSYVALQAARRRVCRGLLLLAPAVKRFDYAAVPLPECPTLVIQGGADEIAPPDAVLAWLNSAEPAPELVWLDGVGHFFHGQLTRLTEIVTEFVADA